MKKIYSFALAAVAILSAASCQKELVNDNLVEGGDFTVTATVAATKTVMDDAAKAIYWTPGDKITLFDTENKTVSFSTDITSNATTAKFTNDAEFNAPASLLAIYPAKADAVYDGTTINLLRIAGTQTAVAGSFDPAFAVAVGQEAEEGVLKFSNVHSLVKFTIGGEKAPAQVVLTNGGARNIAGQFSYNVSTGKIGQNPDAGAKAITLNPAAGESFKVGETYYIAVIGGGNFANVTLAFDGEVVKKVEGAKYADETNGFLINKIIDFGTVSFPVENPDDTPVEPIEATLVNAFQSHGDASYMTALGASAGKDRNIAIDDEYLYIPETQGTPVMWKVSLADGTASRMPVGTVQSGVTFALACPRILPNTDPAINGGNDVLVVSSMGMGGEETYLYFYKNGVDADPHKVAIHNGGNINRRLGDKMTLYGTMQGWALYYKEQGTSAIISYSGTPGVLSASDIWPVGRNYMDPTSDTALGAIYFYSKETAGKQGLMATADNAKYGILNSNVQYEGKPVYQAQAWGTDPNLSACHGFNFFKHNGKDYIAYTSYKEKKLYIIEGASSADAVKAALEAKRVVFEASIAAEDNACYSGNSAADCSVYQKDGNTYVAGHIQNVGVVVYKLN